MQAGAGGGGELGLGLGGAQAARVGGIAVRLLDAIGDAFNLERR